MSGRAVVQLGFDTTIEGQDICIEFTRTTKFGRELYGSDADGNRGMLIDTIDEDESSNVKVTFEDGNEVPLERLPSELRAKVEAAVQEWMDVHDAVAPEEPEEDFDDRDEDE